MTLTVEGDLAVVSSSTGLALYRIAQESMANVVKHAPGSDAWVTLTIGSRSAHLSICNTASESIRHPRGDGLGITGMRERAALVGGTLEAGADETAWLVVADLPIGAE